MDVHQQDDKHSVERGYETFEMSAVQRDSHSGTPAVLSAQASLSALRGGEPQDGANVQELPPVDSGVQAWTFCAAGFVLEMMVWGFGYRQVDRSLCEQSG